jgi:hypothetical protein
VVALVVVRELHAMKMKRSVAEYKSEIAERLDAFARSLPKQLDAPAISIKKLPGMAMWYRETMIWRFTELAQDALEKLERKRFASAMVLTRAAVETGAGLWYLHEKIKKAIAANDLGDLGEKLEKLNVGYKEPSALVEFPEAISALTFVKHLNKKIDNFERSYATLCEYSHPNHQGAAGLFSWPHPDTGLVDFGSNIRGMDTHENICALNLSASVMMFDHCYAAIAKSMPQLVALCEKGV